MSDREEFRGLLQEIGGLMMVDLATFAPTSAKEMLQGITQAATEAAGASWKAVRKDVADHFKFIASMTITTSEKLANGTIGADEARHRLEMLQFNLNAALIEAEMIPNIVGQRVLDAVFGVVRAAIRNVVHIDIVS